MLQRSFMVMIVVYSAAYAILETSNSCILLEKFLNKHEVTAMSSTTNPLPKFVTVVVPITVTTARGSLSQTNGFNQVFCIHWQGT